MKQFSLVSVIIPTYKRSDFLLRTIDSILNQTYPNIEIIVVDDNGLGTEFQKKTQEKLRHLIHAGSIIYIPHEINKNGSAARNTGLYASQGEYIKFLDDDDFLMCDCIEKQLIFLSNTGEEYGATYCGHEVLYNKNGNEKNVKFYATLSGDIHEELYFDKVMFNTSTLLFKRACILKLNGFDESYRRHQDLELLTRFFGSYKVCATEGDCLVRWDMSDRQNAPAPDIDYIIKEKFLKQFDSQLTVWGIQKQFSQHMWYRCALNAIAQNNSEYLIKSIKKMGGVHSLTIHQIKNIIRLQLSKSFIFRKLWNCIRKNK